MAWAKVVVDEGADQVLGRIWPPSGEELIHLFAWRWRTGAQRRRIRDTVFAFPRRFPPT